MRTFSRRFDSAGGSGFVCEWCHVWISRWNWRSGEQCRYADDYHGVNCTLRWWRGWWFKLFNDLIIIVLFLCKGFQHVSRVQDFPVGKWNDLIAVMLTTPFLLIRSFLPPMLNKRWGRIINVASVHSLKASPFKSAYCSAKHGLAGLTKAWDLKFLFLCK